MTDSILELISEIRISGFFVTVEFIEISDVMPQGIETFILQKLESIHNGVTARKFVYKEGHWRMFFIFYPTDKVVDEKYAMKNYVVKKRC